MLQLVISVVLAYREKTEAWLGADEETFAMFVSVVFALVREGAKPSLECWFLGSSRHMDADSLAVMPRDEHFIKDS